MIGQTPDGKNVYSVAHHLKAEGWGIGIMSSVPIDHATPASHYAHVAKRSNYYTIGTHLASSNFDFYGGGGFQAPLDKNNPKAANVYDICKDSGYTFVGSYADAQQHLHADKLVLIPQSDLDQPNKGTGALPYAIDRKKDELSLANIVDIAIQYLSSYDKFFLMAEGGKIDYAGHANDGATNIHETLDLDEAVQVAYRFYEQHPDETLIVITADHETGGLALGNGHSLDLQVLQYQQCSSDILSSRLSDLQKQYAKQLTWEQVKNLISENTGLYTKVSIDEEDDAALQHAYQQMMRAQSSVKTLYADINALAAKALEILNKKAGLGWTTGSHTATAVPIYAIGVGAEQFTGWMDNSQIAPRIYQATR